MPEVLTAGRIRRTVEAGAFVSIWLVAGEVLGMSTKSYPLCGIPLTASFQLLVWKRPIKEL